VQVYTHAHVLAGPRLAPMRDAVIRVQDGRIASIGPEPEPVTGTAGLDLGGAWVLPAFVNAHTHIADTAGKELAGGLDVEHGMSAPDSAKNRLLRSLDEAALQASIRQGALEMLRHGICAFGDFREGGLAGVRALRQACAGLPIRAVALGRPLFTPGMDDAARVREMEAVAAEADGFGIGGLEAFGLGPLQQLRAILGDGLLAIHLAESPRETARCLAEHGETEIVRALRAAPDLMVHLTHATPHDLDLLAARGQQAVFCPRSNMALADGIPPLAGAYTRGWPVALGSDNMMISSPDLFREMDTASRLARAQTLQADAIDCPTLLRAATVDGARALRLDGQLGQLAPGMAASFLALDPQSDAFRYSHDPLASIVHRCAPSDIRHFVCDGVPVIREGRFLF